MPHRDAAEKVIDSNSNVLFSATYVRLSEFEKF